jgi:predicted dehydrogenase
LIDQDEVMTVRWGVVGPGRIASKVVGDAPHVPGAEFVAVASRSAERAQAFASTHGIPRAYDTYEAILAADDVDVLYIATTHPQHRAIALAALRAGKAILVEKAFTVTPEATREIVDLATSTGRFAMEAMWTRFQPAVVRARELIAEGALGEVRSVQGELCVQANLDAGDRFLNPAIGGGAVFDLSVYPISFAQMVLGTPDVVHVEGLLAPTSVDLEESMLLGFPGGRSASLFCSLRCASPGQMRIYGTEGWIDVLPRFHHPDTIVVHRLGAEPETIVAPHTGAGYAHELIEVTDCVAAGKTQSDVMPLADTVAVQDVMGEVVRQLGALVREGPAEL